MNLNHIEEMIPNYFSILLNMANDIIMNRLRGLYIEFILKVNAADFSYPVNQKKIFTVPFYVFVTNKLS